MWAWPNWGLGDELGHGLHARSSPGLASVNGEWRNLDMMLAPSRLRIIPVCSQSETPNPKIQ